MFRMHSMYKRSMPCAYRCGGFISFKLSKEIIKVKCFTCNKLNELLVDMQKGSWQTQKDSEEVKV